MPSDTCPAVSNGENAQRQSFHESVRRLIKRGLVVKKTKNRRVMLRLTEAGYQAYRWLMRLETIRRLEEK